MITTTLSAPLWEPLSTKLQRAINLTATRLEMVKEFSLLEESAYDVWFIDTLESQLILLSLLQRSVLLAEKLNDSGKIPTKYVISLFVKGLYVASKILGEDISLPWRYE